MTFSLAGVATGIGSHPGSAPTVAAEIIVGEASLPYVPELPARGIGADMIGRTAAVLTDTGFDTSTTGYRVGVPRGAAARRAASYLREDLDALEEAREVARVEGAVKLQFCGPLTLVGSLELRSGHRVPRDTGAVRDIVDALADGIAEQVIAAQRRFGGDVVVQLDEPMAEMVIEGRLPMISKLSPVPAIPASDARRLLGIVVGASRGAGAAQVIVHACQPAPPWQVFSAFGNGEQPDGDGVTALSIDLAAVKPLGNAAQADAIGSFMDAGGVVGFGVVPATRATGAPVEKLLEPVLTLVDRLGLPRKMLRTNAFVTPACGLAGADEAAVRGILAAVQAAADALTDPEALP